MRIVIIEDEEAAVRRLKKLIAQIDARHDVLAHLDSVSTAVSWLRTHAHPDLLLMDIHLADGSSFEIFKHAEIQCPVIFTTAYDQYAIDAFRVHAIDYLLKPVKAEELNRALARIADPQIRSSQVSKIVEGLSRTGLMPQVQRTLVKIGQSIRLLDLNSIAYFYSQEKITFAVTPANKRMPIDDSLEALESKLDGQRYFRINRQLIIGIDAIDEMYAYSKSRVKIILKPPLAGRDVIVSTERSPHFKRWLTGEIE